MRSTLHPADATVVGHEMHEFIHILSLPKDVTTIEEQAETKRKLLDLIEKDKAVKVYQRCCAEFGWIEDEELVARYESENAKILEEHMKALEEAEAQYGDAERRDAKLVIAHHYSRIGDHETARDKYEALLKDEKAIESSSKVNILLTLVRMAFFDSSSTEKQVKEGLDRVEEQFERGGDWETRNRMRVYKALYLATYQRKFDKAADLLILGLATFTASELISFRHFVELTILLSMCSLPRPILLSQLTKSPEVLQVLAEDDALNMFFSSFMTSDYRNFFLNYAEATMKIRRDQFVSEHYRYFVRQMRLAAYRQYLRPFKSVSIPAMAEAFGVPEHFIEDQITSFMSTGMLKAKVDRVDQTIVTTVENETETLYQQVLQVGDSLMNELQMLSRVIDL